MNDMYMEGTPEEAKHLYERILKTANHFLHNAKAFHMQILQDHNPTYEEVAELMKMLAPIVADLADDFDPLLGQKAINYAGIMRRMALAIRDSNEISLKNEIDILDKLPLV